MRPAGLAASVCATAVAAVGASFAALDAWVDARADAIPPADEALAAPPVPPRVEVSIDPTLGERAYGPRGPGFAPYFDIRESTFERVRMESRFVDEGGEVDAGAPFAAVTELVVARHPDGSLSGVLTRGSGGGCLAPFEGTSLTSSPAQLSVRVVLGRDWVRAREAFPCLIEFGDA